MQHQSSSVYDNGDGVMRIAPYYFSQVAASISRIPPSGGVLPTSSKQLMGLNMDLMIYLAAAGNFSFTVDNVQLPPSVLAQGSQKAYLNYVFNVMSPPYDCVISKVFVDPADLATFSNVNFLTPHQQARRGAVIPAVSAPEPAPLPMNRALCCQFGYTLVTPPQPLEPKTVAEQLFAWTDPFMKQIWLCVFGSLFASSTFMYILEGRARGPAPQPLQPPRSVLLASLCALPPSSPLLHVSQVNEIDFGPTSHRTFVRLGQGFYRALSNLCCVGGFTPHTPAGQTFTVAFSFAMLLVQSAYTANLAAYFTRADSPAVLIDSIASFSQINAPLCVVNETTLVELLQSNYPAVTFVPVAGDTATIFSSILAGLPPAPAACVLFSPLLWHHTASRSSPSRAGVCRGALVIDFEADYALGPGDPSGRFCSLSAVGGNVNQNLMAIPFNNATVDSAVVAALSNVVAGAITYGDYAVMVAGNFPGGNRADACSSYLAIQDSLLANQILNPLSFTQLAGIFFVMALGIGAATIMWSLFETNNPLQRRLCPGDWSSGVEIPVDAPQEGGKIPDTPLVAEARRKMRRKRRDLGGESSLGLPPAQEGLLADLLQQARRGPAEGGCG